MSLHDAQSDSHFHKQVILAQSFLAYHNGMRVLTEKVTFDPANRGNEENIP
jgi:hypothetical protein